MVGEGEGGMIRKSGIKIYTLPYLKQITSGDLLFDTQNPKMTDLEDAAYLVSFQFSSVTQSCPTLCDPMDCSTPGFPVHQQLPELTQSPVHQVSDAIQPSHPLLSPSPPTFNLSQHQGLFQGVSSSHQVAKVLEFQLQHQCFQ